MAGSDSPVTFYLGIGSRYSYLASTQLNSLAQRTGKVFEWRPIMSSTFTASGQQAPFAWDDESKDWWGARVSGQYRESYRQEDLARWAAFYGVPYCEPKPPAMDAERRTLYCVAACMSGQGAAYVSAMYARMYADGAVISEDVCLALADETGLSRDDLRASVENGLALETHELWVEEGRRAGVFGVPTFVHSGQLFWGNDRLPLLEENLSS